MDERLPSLDQSSSAAWGASGAIILVNASATSRGRRSRPMSALLSSISFAMAVLNPSDSMSRRTPSMAL